MSQSSFWRILRKRLRVKGFRLQLLQVLNPQDHNLRLRFYLDFQQWLLKDGFAEELVFSDEATFHVCGKVYRHNVRIWAGTACSFRSAQAATLLEFHVPFTNCFVCRWFCVVHDPKPPLHSHN